MIKLGITGGIGSGKSVLSRILKALGYPVYIADDKAKSLMVSDDRIINDIKKLLGEQSYIDGKLNKQCIAAYLFDNPGNTARINQIVHPRVRDDFEYWCAINSEAEILSFESAILFEANFLDAVDYSVLVYAPETMRINRAVARDNSTHELIKKRILAQASDEWKMEQVDYVIRNDHQDPLLPQVLQMVGDLLKK